MFRNACFFEGNFRSRSFRMEKLPFDVSRRKRAQKMRINESEPTIPQLGVESINELIDKTLRSYRVWSLGTMFRNRKLTMHKTVYRSILVHYEKCQRIRLTEPTTSYFDTCSIPYHGAWELIRISINGHVNWIGRITGPYNLSLYSSIRLAHDLPSLGGMAFLCSHCSCLKRKRGVQF